MALEELDKMAYSLQVLPEDLPPPETYYFLTMRALYAMFALKQLSEEQARREKKQVFQQYQDFDLLRKIGMQERHILESIRKSGNYYNKNGCPTCKRLANQLCGLPIKEEWDKWESCDLIKPTSLTD